MHILAQFPITPSNVDKFLSLDLPSLVLVVAVIVGLTLLVSSYFQGRGQLANDAQQTAVIKFFTDENSPMVTSNKQAAENSRRVAEAVELANKRSAEQTEALLALGKKTDDQTNELGKQTAVIESLSSSNKEFSTLVTKDLSAQTESIADLKRSIDVLNESISTLIKDRQDCLGLREQLSAFRVEFMDKLSQQNKKATQTTEIVVPEQALKVELPAVSEPGLN